MPSAHSSSRFAAAIAVAVAVAVVGVVAQSGPAAGSAAQEKKAGAQAGAQEQTNLAKLSEPWPSPEKLSERRLAAEKLPLFSIGDPVAFTLRADFKAVNRDRDPNSTRRFPATLVVAGPDGQVREIPVQIGTRGNARLSVRVCSAVPLKVEFPEKTLAAGTVFEGQDELKLVTNCKDDSIYEQYVLREYLAYRVFNLFTTRSYRVRLARATYMDSSAGARVPDAHWAMFIEDNGDVARRMEGRVAAIEKRLFRHLDPDTLTRMMLLQYLVANTDISIFTLHNVRLVQERHGALHPVSYDFDYAGLVDAHYARPDRQFGISSVRERLYRGPCRPLNALEPFFQEFRRKKDELLALYDSLPELDSGYRRDSKRYLEEFYKTIDSPNTAKRVFLDKCAKVAGI
jgi:hypothetical protein